MNKNNGLLVADYNGRLIMNKRNIVAALVAAVLVSGVPAFAQDHGYRNDRSESRDNRDNNWQQQRDNRWQPSQQRGRDEYRGDNARGNWGRTADFNSGYDGAGPNHDLRRGGRLPSRYRTHQYVVDNYRVHHLSAPPRGYHWVQTGADYVLVGAATGLIAQIVMGN
jgi:Ni/Co efflux regulator RcnB